MCSIVLDIETGPRPIDELKSVIRPFDRSSIKDPGVFDPASVKYGNTKDEAKRKEKLDECMKKHQEEVENFQANLIKAENGYWSDIEQKGALSSLTGEVLLIGVLGNQAGLLHGAPEADMLVSFWSKFTQVRAANRKFVGFNIRGFDLPFLIQRSIILSVDIPEGVFDGRYLSSIFVDLNDIWMAGGRGFNGNLDEICKACGLPGKPDDVSGADFAKLYRNVETQPQALEYAMNDLQIIRNLAIRIGV